MPEQRSAPASSRETRILVAGARLVLQPLAVLIRNASFHDLSNEVFDEPLQRLLVSLERPVADEGTLRIERVGQELFANGARLRMELRSVHTYKLVCEELEQRGLGGIEFGAELTEAGAREFLALLMSFQAPGDDCADLFNEALQKSGVVGISALDSRAVGEGALAGSQTEGRRDRALRTYQEALDFIRSCITELESPLQVNQRRAKRVIHKLVDLAYEGGDGFSMIGLASIKDHDHYTFNHMVNVCVLSVAFGHRLGLSRRELAELGLCALYHDMGKLHIPAEVLNKPGRLNTEEWALMGNHTVYGARTLFPQLAQDSRVMSRILVALQHHHGYTGQGYPTLRVLAKQTLYSRVVALVDVFDAMTTKRVYQEEFLPDAALRRMLELGGEYLEPTLVKAFVNCMGIFPVGSTVRLAGDEIAVVVEANPDPARLDRPKVRMVMDSHRRLMEDPFFVDLAEPGETSRRIVECVDPEALGINSAYYAV